MKVYLTSNHINEKDVKRKLIGDTPQIVIPKIGKHVFVGYNPAPLVENIIYNYIQNEVYVILDTSFI